MKNVIYFNRSNNIVTFLSEEEAINLRNKGVKSIAIHNAEFHADDVSAVVLAILKFGEVIIYRLPDIYETTNIDMFDFIVDVGKRFDGVKFFDHHQPIDLYEDGVKPCGVTLFAKAIWDKEEYDTLYERILRPIAVKDNGHCDLIAS